MKRRAALVCEHLEHVSRDALARYQDLVRQYVRRRQGVYALYRRGKLYYVGLASNLRSRLGNHLTDRHGNSWDRFSVYLTIGDSHLRELEALILRIVRPAGNSQRGRFAKSADIRRRFSKDVRALQRAELHEMLGRATRTRALEGRAKRAPKGRIAVLSRYGLKSTTLRARFKQTLYTARVLRDGSIRFHGKRYTSPSMAGAAVIKRPCNGWSFWSYQRAPGDWVKLSKLRD